MFRIDLREQVYKQATASEAVCMIPCAQKSLKKERKNYLSSVFTDNHSSFASPRLQLCTGELSALLLVSIAEHTLAYMG